MGVSQLIHPLYTGRPTVIFRPAYPRPPMVTSPQTVLDTLKAVRANGAFVVPSILEAWAHDPATVDYLKTLNILVRRVIPFVAMRLISFDVRSTAAALSLRLSGTRSSQRDAASRPPMAVPSSASSPGSTLRSSEAFLRPCIH